MISYHYKSIQKKKKLRLLCHECRNCPHQKNINRLLIVAQSHVKYTWQQLFHCLQSSQFIPLSGDFNSKSFILTVAQGQSSLSLFGSFHNTYSHRLTF